MSGYFSNTNCQVKILNLGVKDNFVAHGEVANQLSENGLDENQVVKRIQTFLGVENE